MLENLRIFLIASITGSLVLYLLDDMSRADQIKHFFSFTFGGISMWFFFLMDGKE